MDSSTTNQTYTIFDPEVGFDQYLHRTDIKTTNTLNGSSLLPNAVANPTVTNNINAGEMPSLIGYGKYQFSDTNSGWLQELDVDNKFKWFIGTSTSSADWNVTAPDTFTIKGSISATTGTIGGFVIGVDYIRDLANSFGLASTAGTGAVRFWAGATFANRNTAPFRLTENGIMTFTDNSTRTLVLSTGKITITDAGNNQIFNLADLTSAILYIRPSSNDQTQGGLTVQNQGTGSYTALNAPLANTLVGFKVFNSTSTANTLYLENAGVGSGTPSNGNCLGILAQGSTLAMCITKVGTAATAILLNQSTSAIGLDIEQSGNGRALYINNSGSGGSSVYVDHSGSGTLMLLNSTNTSTVQDTTFIKNDGLGTTLHLSATKSTNTSDTLLISQDVASTANFILANPGGAKLTSAGVWTNASSRTLKENFKPIEYDILEKLKTLEVPLYTYIRERQNKKIDPSLIVPWHLTPMAEDFNEMFGLGDNKTISAADIAGVALVAIQQLLKKLNI